MKKIHLILKTHLDLGFTDYADNVINRYRTKFIPSAINLAEKLNTKEHKVFVWTTGSWLIKDSLDNMDESNRQRLLKAIENGDIAWHGLPFTTHTELLDVDTFNYGLSIAKGLDARFNKKTISAKMTDVPGHTKAMIPLLEKAGIKLLHIGVNEASRVPDVPNAFLWKYENSELIVIYEGSYGSLYKNEYIDDILYFFHSADNHGPSNEKEIKAVYARLKEEYPDYEIVASTLDDYAKVIWEVKDKLPVITQEIGDTWIHGVATDPFKTGAFKVLSRLKEALLKVDDGYYAKVSDALLRIAEHTWGGDVKIFFKDFKHYLKKDFERARQKDVFKRFSAIELSWKEQRAYIDEAIDCFPDNIKEEVREKIARLMPKKGFDLSGLSAVNINDTIKLNDFIFKFDKNGLKTLMHNETLILNNKNGLSTINYRGYSHKDYDFWLNHYTRNYDVTKVWSEPDFLRPNLYKYEGKYPSGRFNYEVSEIFANNNQIVLKMQAPNNIVEELGVPKDMEIKYSCDNSVLNIEIIWLCKEASRLSEATFFNLPIECKKENTTFYKLGNKIDLFDVVNNGSRNLSCIEKIEVESQKRITIYNLYSPLVSIGKGKILEFDNEYGNLEHDGVSFVLNDNVWGTNFPLWYEDNAYFMFTICVN